MDDRADRVQLQLELGHDPEVAAAAAEPPEEPGALALARADELPVGGDDVRADEVVAGEPVLAHQPADAAAEREAADAGRRDEPAGRGETVRLRLVVDVRPDRAAADVGDARVRVDPDVPHRREVDDEAVVGRREPGDAVRAAAHRERQVVAAREADRRDHVGGARTAHDQRRAAFVEHAVPDVAGLLVAGVAGGDHLALHGLAKLLHRRFPDHRGDRCTHVPLLVRPCPGSCTHALFAAA